VPESLHVLEVQVARIIEIHIRLRRAAHQQSPGPRPVRVSEQLDGVRLAKPADGRSVPPRPAAGSLSHVPS
jgi:hypothetical protein